MSSDYTYACQRAELLGLPVPTEEEWAKSRAEEKRDEDDENRVNEDVDDAALRNLEHDDETAKRVSGGLDELNSILSATQKKINRFKTVCGSLGTLLKVRVGSRPGTPSREISVNSTAEGNDARQESAANEQNPETSPDNPGDVKNAEKNTGAKVSAKKIDLNEKMGSHLDKLDSLITKAENAQYSMQHQTKQMRRFLN